MDFVGGGRRDDGEPLRRALFENELAVFAFHALDDERFRGPLPLAGEHGVGERQIFQRHLAAAEVGGREAPQFAVDARFFRQHNHRVEPRGQPEPHRGRVLGFDQGVVRRDRAFILVVGGFRPPFPEDAGHSADHHLPVVEGRVLVNAAGENPLLKGRRIDNREKAGPGRAVGEQGAVVLIVGEIASADQSEHATGGVIQSHERPLEVGGRRKRFAAGLFAPGVEEGVVLRIRGVVVIAAAFHLFQARFQRILPGFLQPDVERGIDPEPVTVDALIIAEQPRHLLSDELDCVRFTEDRAAILDRQRLGHGAVIVGPLDPIELQHAAQHESARFQARLAVAPRGELVGAAQHPCQRCAFGEVQLPGGLAEIATRSGFDPVEPGAEIDAVEIEFQDLVFAEILLNPLRHQGFNHLAMEAPVAAGKGVGKAVAGELLGDGGCPLPDSARLPIAQRGARHADVVDAVVLPEAVILGGNERGDDVRRHLGPRNGVPVLDVDFAELLAGAVVDDAGRFHVAELREIERVGLGSVDLQEVIKPTQAGDRAQEQKGHQREKPGAAVKRFSCRRFKPHSLD